MPAVNATAAIPTAVAPAARGVADRVSAVGTICDTGSCEPSPGGRHTTASHVVMRSSAGDSQTGTIAVVS
jgi:hypothetical protein